MQNALSSVFNELEPLTEASRYRVEDFDCGDAGMNSFVKEHAWRQQRKLLNRTFLVRYDPPDSCPGFISLSTAHIASQLTGLFRNQLVYENAPALLIARMGVDRRFQRRGFARDLMAAARLVAQTLPAGCRFLVLHVAVANTPALALYDSEGFRVPEGYEPDENGLLLMFYDLATRKPAGQVGLSFASS